MAEAKTKIEETLEISIEAKLRALYDLQQVDTETDKIKILRGELPLEVQDLEDDIAGLETRIRNFEEEVKSLEHNIAGKKQDISNSESLIKKYEEQQKNVRNNREFDSLSKEMEFQNLEIELARKKIILTWLQGKNRLLKQQTFLQKEKTIWIVKRMNLMKLFLIPKKKKKLYSISLQLYKRLLNPGFYQPIREFGAMPATALLLSRLREMLAVVVSIKSRPRGNLISAHVRKLSYVNIAVGFL
jgi:hypothetical protein